MMALNTSVPAFLFPVCHVGEDKIETTIKIKTLWGFNQRLNQVEYGTLSACTLPQDGDETEKLRFRNDGN